MVNQGVTTEDKLDKLKNISGVKFDLPFNDETFRTLVGLRGKLKTRGWKPGVYIFTYMPTGNKDVGLSNSLYIRLDLYFNF